MPSFDIVSQVDMQEVRNAVDQSMREVVNRYDFKGTDTKISLTDDGIVIESATDNRVEAAIDVLQTKLVKRKVSLKSISGGEIKPDRRRSITGRFHPQSGHQPRRCPGTRKDDPGHEAEGPGSDPR